MKINYGIIAVDVDESDANFLKILHFVGYEKKPEQIDYDSLFEELKNDVEFGLTHLFNSNKKDQLILMEAPESIVEHYKEIFKKLEKA
jgi:hypothetical protein